MTETENKKRTNRRPGLGVGTVSLLVIFTVLCFSTLALLSLSSAVNYQNTMRPSQQGALSLAAAEGEAAQKLAELDTMLMELQIEMQVSDANDAQSSTYASTARAYYDRAAQKAEGLGFEILEDTQQLRFALPIDENHELVTEIVLHAPGADIRYIVVKQASVMTGEWDPGSGEGQLWPG